MARFTPHTDDDIREMLEAIGVESLDDLFADVSPKLEGTLNLPPTLSEYEALSDVSRLAAKNVTGLPIFLGAGAYDRITPTAVGAVTSRGEFLTSYTPYQPEISQGVLQTIFEFQSVIVELTHNNGTTDFSEVPEYVSGVFVQNPNYHGVVEDVGAASEAAHAVGALAVAVCDPISLAVLEAPGNLGAAVAVGGGQPPRVAPPFRGAG